MKYFTLVCVFISMLSLSAFGVTGDMQSSQHMIIVPNVEGVTLEVAAFLLRSAGLQPQLPAAAQSAVVVRQDPRPGFRLAPGSSVVLSTDLVAQQPRQIVSVDSQRSIVAVNSGSQIASGPGTPASNMPQGQAFLTGGTMVMVTPQQPTIGQQNQQSIQGTALSPPTYARVVQNQIPGSSLAWYPKQFLSGAPQGSMTITTPSQPSATMTQTQTANSRLAWYPKQFLAGTAPQNPGTMARPSQQSTIMIPNQPSSPLAWYPKQFLQGTAPQGSMAITTPAQPAPIITQTQTSGSYLAWYPKQFLPQTASHQSTITVQPLHTSSTMQVDSATIPRQSTVQYYPSVAEIQGASSSVTSTSTVRVGVYQASLSPAVLVPNVIRLSQQDAAAAIARVGLSVSSVTFVDSAQVRSGYVVRQSPQGRRLAQQGGAVHLWIAR
jgi:beta-lactam-binding protein with PASTA domain